VIIASTKAEPAKEQKKAEKLPEAAKEEKKAEKLPDPGDAKPDK
jgi:hypothetical protein